MLKKVFSIAIIVLMLCTISVMDANAQRGRRARNTNNTNTTDNPTNTNTPPVDTTMKTGTDGVQQQNNNLNKPTYNPTGNIPIVVSKAQTDLDTIRKSLRNDGAVDYNSINNQRLPLPYQYLRADDAMYIERVWRNLDLHEKMNQVFKNKMQNDNGDQRFISILLNAIRSGELVAFDASVDDRFTTPLDSTALGSLLSGGTPDTIAVYGDLTQPDKITSYSVVYKSFNPDDVQAFQLKEEWVFDRTLSQLYCRILGIAPLKTVKRTDGSIQGVTPLFWVYYPDLRPVLARNQVYNSKNMGMGRMTWEELFEARMFGSYIVKSTLDNPLNLQIRQYIKDPLRALLEGETVTNKIFDYEQNLWSY